MKTLNNKATNTQPKYEDRLKSYFYEKISICTREIGEKEKKRGERKERKKGRIEKKGEERDRDRKGEIYRQIDH